MTFSRNEAHFTAVPHAERLLLEAQPDPTQQVDAWRRGDVDLVWPVSGAQVEDLWDERGFVVAAEATVSYFAAYNFGNPTRYEPGWMAFPGIREALSLAIDREGYARDVFGGFIHVERAGFMTQSWAIDPSVRNPTRNVDEANRILDAEGWLDQDGDGVRESPSGDSANLVCIVREDADPGLLGILDRLDADLREIGVRLEVQRLAPDAFTLRWTTAFDYDLSAWSLTQYGAFAEFDLVGSPWSIRRNPAGWNPGGYWNPEVDEAISVYFQSWRQEDMAQALRTIQRLTNDDPFALWLGFPQQPVLIRPDVAGFQPNRVWQSWNTWSLWRSEGAADLVTPMAAPETVPVASPVATPVTSTPIASIPGTPGATPAPR
jgi:ABC-type transport system substrate-binding protein